MPEPTIGSADSHELDVDRYYRLPRTLRERVDDWLRAEGLFDANLTWFRVTEGAVEAERWVTGPDGQLLHNGGELITERFVHRVRTAPPREALT